MLFCDVLDVELPIELMPPQFVAGGGGIVNEDAGGVEVLPGGGGSVKDGCRAFEFSDILAIEAPILPVDALDPNPEEPPHGLDVAGVAADQLIEAPEVDVDNGFCGAIGCMDCIDCMGCDCVGG